jgi:class II lanthipeptide synthase
MHDDLIAVAADVDLPEPQRFVVAGYEASTADPGTAYLAEWRRGTPDESAGVERAPDAETLLAAMIYEHCYLRPYGPGPRVLDLAGERAFELALLRSTTDRAVWENGWLAEHADTDGHRVAVRLGVRFWVDADGLRLTGSDREDPRPCAVLVPNVYRRLFPGFHMVMGDAPSEELDRRDEAVVRLYWHLTNAAAPKWLAQISRKLNGEGIAFRAKVLASPYAYRRADAGVLYVAQRDFARTSRVLPDIYFEVREGLRDDVPLFTERLARGLGVAEDPGGGMSFGQHRCRLIARALLAARQGEAPDLRAKLRAIFEAFRREGLDPLAPHLQAGSVDAYEVPWNCAHDRPHPGRGPTDGAAERRTTTASAPRSQEELLAAAVEIGEALCRTAYWDESRELCNWIGRSNKGTPMGTLISPRTDALSWDLYGGASGVALFLAELFACTHEPAFRRAGLGAIRCSLAQMDRLRAAGDIPALGFYSGLTGLAYAAARVGERTQERVLDDGLLQLVAAAVRASQAAEGNDFLGRAGAIPALLLLSRLLAWPEARDWALEIGEELCRSGVTARHAKRQTSAEVPPLTGLAHGAAGIGLSLLELHADTRRRDFLEAARTVFDYEDHLFDPDVGNWPDLRRSTRNPGETKPRFSVAWCHGAPGIALSRLRASELDPARADHYLDHARAGLETTRRHLRPRGAADGSDRTPCHGIAGLVEALSTAGHALDEPTYRAAALEGALELARAGSGLGMAGSGTLCGGPNPSLMLGAAGVGYHLLRVHRADLVPRVLTIPS